MARRGNGEGSIYRRGDGRWVAAISLPNGRRKAFCGQRREDVAARLAAALRARHDGLPVVGERLTLGKFLSDWLEAVRPSLRLESYRRYEDVCRLHVIPELGAIPLAKLSPARIQAA